MHERTDLVELCTMHYITRNFVVGTAKNGPFEVLTARFLKRFLTEKGSASNEQKALLKMDQTGLKGEHEIRLLVVRRHFQNHPCVRNGIVAWIEVNDRTSSAVFEKKYVFSI